MVTRGAGEMRRGRVISQVFCPGRNYFSGVSPIVGTYRSVQSSHFTFSLFKLRGPPTKLFLRAIAKADAMDCRFSISKFQRAIHFGLNIIRKLLLLRATRLAESTFSCAAIYDNTPVTIFTEADPHSTEQHYFLRILSSDATDGNAATVWLSDEGNRIEGHVCCLVDGVREGNLGLLAHVGYANPVSEHIVPPSLLISTTTQCNLNCVHCISSFTRNQLNRLTPEIRTKIKSWYDKRLIKYAATDYSGDVLWSDDRFGGDLDLFFGLDVPFEIVTNGVCLTRDVARRLMNSRIKMLNVSLDAARDETFRRVRKGAPPLKDILANMKAASEERKNSNRMDVIFAVSFTLMRSNLGELVDAIQLVRDSHFDMLFANHLEAYTADMVDESLWFDHSGFNETRKIALKRAADIGVQVHLPPPFEDRPERKGHLHCEDAWESAMILGNGDVHVCCIPSPELRMGNLYEQSMEEIWAGPSYQNFRRLVNSQNPPVACNNCPRRRITNNRGSYTPYEYLARTAKSE